MWRRLYFFLFHCARWMQIPSFMKNRPTTFKPLSLIALVESWRWILALEMRKLDILLPHLLPLLPHQYHQFRRRAPPQKPPFVSITLRTTYVGTTTKHTITQKLRKNSVEIVKIHDEPPRSETFGSLPPSS